MKSIKEMWQSTVEFLSYLKPTPKKYRKAHNFVMMAWQNNHLEMKYHLMLMKKTDPEFSILKDVDGENNNPYHQIFMLAKDINNPDFIKTFIIMDDFLPRSFLYQPNNNGMTPLAFLVAQQSCVFEFLKDFKIRATEIKDFFKSDSEKSDGLDLMRLALNTPGNFSKLVKNLSLDVNYKGSDGENILGSILTTHRKESLLEVINAGADIYNLSNFRMDSVFYSFLKTKNGEMSQLHKDNIMCLIKEGLYKFKTEQTFNEKGEENDVSDLRMIFSVSVRKFLVEEANYPLNLEAAKNSIVSAIIRHEDDMIESINYFIDKGADPKKITNNKSLLEIGIILNTKDENTHILTKIIDYFVNDKKYFNLEEKCPSSKSNYMTLILKHWNLNEELFDFLRKSSFDFKEYLNNDEFLQVGEVSRNKIIYHVKGSIAEDERILISKEINNKDDLHVSLKRRL